LRRLRWLLLVVGPLPSLLKPALSNCLNLQ
jgi:hypothetical protein